MPSHPHDRLVKKVLSNPKNAAGELQAILPSALAERIDWATLELQPGSFVDEEGREWHTDLLFSAQLEGKRAYLRISTCSWSIRAPSIVGCPCACWSTSAASGPGSVSKTYGASR